MLNQAQPESEDSLPIIWGRMSASLLFGFLLTVLLWVAAPRSTGGFYSRLYLWLLLWPVELMQCQDRNGIDGWIDCMIAVGIIDVLRYSLLIYLVSRIVDRIKAGRKQGI
jgi:hypothetical protein